MGNLVSKNPDPNPAPNLEVLRVERQPPVPQVPQQQQPQPRPQEEPEVIEVQPEHPELHNFGERETS